MRVKRINSLEDLTEQCQKRLEIIFTNYLQDIPSLDLKSALSAALVNRGKQLRPLLVYATANIFNASLDATDLPAAAVECMHTYSLIHDDLPSMDDADLRRGKPTCHKVYGEGMAILVGDALQSFAIEIIARKPAPLNNNQRIQMIAELSYASGAHGMVAGQALDISVMDNVDKISTDLLTDIYRLKTGALITACIKLGYLASIDDDIVNQQALTLFGELIGLAFQIQDDILDVEGHSSLLGKTQGIDYKNKKITYPAQFGILAAKEKVNLLYEEALESIKIFGTDAHLLRELTTHMLQRKN